ncbi:hypothetical protein D9M73_231360 [compost metagenome]
MLVHERLQLCGSRSWSLVRRLCARIMETERRIKMKARRYLRRYLECGGPQGTMSSVYVIVVVTPGRQTLSW